MLTTPLRAQASGLSVVRCEQYALPRKITEAVDLIAPTTHFPSVRAKAPAHQKASLPPLAVTPKVLRDIYELGNASGAAPNNRVAVTGFLKEFFQKDSLARRPARPKCTTPHPMSRSRWARSFNTAVGACAFFRFDCG